MLPDDLILFAKADISQAYLIRDILHIFCMESGQKVRFDKSHVLISRNFTTQLGQSLSNILNIPSATNLGKYLGVPSIQMRVTKSTYKAVLDKVQHRLQGWKARCLSLAARVTLIKAVTSAIPPYAMQTASLPRGICAQIDKCNCRFL